MPFLQLHLSSLGIRRNTTPIPVHEDNAACRMMAENDLKIFNKARHYLVRLGFLQDKVTDGTAKFVQTDTSDMIADALTKPLERAKFEKFRNLMVMDKDEFARLKGIVPLAKAQTIGWGTRKFYL